MNFIKQCNLKKAELAGLILVYVILIVNAILFKDSPVAFVSAFCGITYTVLAGKGYPVCYVFGVTGSGFYSYLALVNALWGNLILYAGYYIPMQVLGFFKWNQNLKSGESDIIKTSLSVNELVKIFILTSVLSLLAFFVLYYFQDKNPIIDGITTIFSIAGMYLTVRRCIEQWIMWMIVNALSLIMWLKIAISGERVYSTVIMWAVYLSLAIYFYISWKKEIIEDKQEPHQRAR